MRIDLRLALVIALAFLVAACPEARPGADRASATMRLVFETSRATRLSVNRAALAPRVVTTSKSIAWKAEGATVGAGGEVTAAGPFTLTATVPVTKGIEYAIRAAANRELTVEARATDDPTLGYESAFASQRVDGFDYVIGIPADVPQIDLKVTGKGDARITRFEVRESLLREPVQLLSAEDTALRAIVTQGRGSSNYREREALLAIGDSDYEWPLPPATESRAIDLETGLLRRHGDDTAQPINAFVELRENGVWREAYKIERGIPSDDGAWRRVTILLGNADAVRLATRKKGSGSENTVTLAWGRAVVRPQARPPQRPDVIFISIDALRADRLGSYGGKLGLSPALDKLASESVVFEESRTARGQTWESLTAMAFATWPEDVGVSQRGDRTNHGAKGIADVFAGHGYFTARIGNVLLMPGQLGGFDVSEDAPTDEIAIDRFRSLLEEEHDRPRFIWMHLASTHYPFNIAPQFLPPGAPEKMDVPWFYTVVHDRGPPDAIATISARADAAVRQVDSEIGALLPLLQDPNRPGGPAILGITADHGSHRGEENLWFMHGSYHRVVLRVPFILSWPGHLQPRRVSSLVRSIDYGPTFIDLAGLPPGKFTGESLAPLTRGEPMAPLMNIVRDSNVIAVVENDRYKAVGANHAHKSWKQASITVEIPDLLLYRWRTDPGEVHDLSAEEPLIAGELLSRVFNKGDLQQQKLSPEAIRLLKQAGYAAEDH